MSELVFTRPNVVMDGSSNSHEDLDGAFTYHDKELKCVKKDIVINDHPPCKRKFHCAPMIQFLKKIGIKELVIIFCIQIKSKGGT